jgi:hypothetical protein
MNSPPERISASRKVFVTCGYAPEISSVSSGTQHGPPIGVQF